MKSLVVHYKNKYPGGRVSLSDSALDVYSADGDLCVSLRKNGAGQWVDQSDEMGARDKHCLSPIPKQSRVFKLHADGKIGRDEKHEERSKFAGKLEREGRILSCEEYIAEGFVIDKEHSIVSGPAKGAAEPAKSLEL